MLAPSSAPLDRCVLFVTGNPALGELELLTGTIKLLDDEHHEHHEHSPLPPPSEAAPKPCAPSPAAASEHHDPSSSLNSNSRRSHVLAMLGVPSRFVPTDVIELLAPFHSSIRAIRLLRHCEPPRWRPDAYIALIELSSTAAAEALYVANERRPFNSFEDDRHGAAHGRCSRCHHPCSWLVRLTP